MLTALHALVYSDDPAATRAFFADVLRWPFISEGEHGDAGVGGAGTGGSDPNEWLIFRTGPSEIGVHPTAGEHLGEHWTSPRKHSISLICDHLEITMAELAGRGARFNGDPRDLGFGRGVLVRVPGADDLLLYEPKHAVAHSLPGPGGGTVPGTDAEWEQHYTPEAIWSGNPNGGLVAEAARLTPGRAVEVGCGEGADAVWLARQGWDVTAFDVAESALSRGRESAERAGVTVDWRRGALLEVDLPVAVFDLVSVCYPALRRTPGRDAEHALLALVGPGGRLLMLSHADVDREHSLQHGFDPEDYVNVDDVRAVIPADWTIETDERRSRDVPTGAGAGHHTDLVLVARRAD